MYIAKKVYLSPTKVYVIIIIVVIVLQKAPPPTCSIITSIESPSSMS